MILYNMLYYYYCILYVFFFHYIVCYITTIRVIINSAYRMRYRSTGAKLDVLQAPLLLARGPAPQAQDADAAGAPGGLVNGLEITFKWPRNGLKMASNWP